MQKAKGKIMKTSKRALILIDLENEWATKGSEDYIGELGDLVGRVNTLIDFCRRAGDKIIFVRHVELGSTESFAAGTPGVELIKKLHRQPDDGLITKHKVSSFYQTELAKELAGVKEVVVGGIMTNQCVRMFAEEAYDRELAITVIKDCCQTFDQATHDFTLRDLKSTRPEIAIASLEEFMKK